MVLQGFAQALRGGAEDLRSRLAGRRGASGGAYTAAWQLWRRGAGEVQVGLSMLVRLIAQASDGYQENEAASAQALRETDCG